MVLQEEIFEKAHYDIIVAGGGVGGAAAAVQAAREGKHVLLVEKSQKLGGLATLGLVNFFVPMCNGRGKQIIFGMAEEMLRLSIKYGYGGVDPAFENGRIPEEKLAEYKANGHQPPRYMTKFSAEIFALTLTELCHDAGVDIMFDSIVSRAVTTSEGGKTKILGVVLENKSGREYFTADMFVDSTGDGDLMYRAGIPTVERGNYHSYFAFRDNSRQLSQGGGDREDSQRDKRRVGRIREPLRRKPPEGYPALSRNVVRRGEPVSDLEPARDARKAEEGRQELARRRDPAGNVPVQDGQTYSGRVYSA